MILIGCIGRYRDRFWRETVFNGIKGIRNALDEVYGLNNVDLVSATFRWMNHHSAMKKEYGGMSVSDRYYCCYYYYCYYYYCYYYCYCYCSDCIIIGGSNIDHITVNVKACEEGPLDQSNCHYYLIIIIPCPHA